MTANSFLLAILIVLVWAVSGPAFDYSKTWQQVINTSTRIITFLMVFIIQKSLKQRFQSQAGPLHQASLKSKTYIIYVACSASIRTASKEASRCVEEIAS